MTQTLLHAQGTVAYETHGVPHAEMTIIWIHGFCEDRRMWWPFIAPFAERYRLVTVDVGGFGAGTLEASCSIADMAEQVEAVREAEGVGACYLVGHSMGGYVATAYAHHYAGMHLKGLTLLHSHPFADDADKQEHRLRAVELLERVGAEKFAAGLIPQLFPAVGREEMRPVIAEMVERARTYPVAVIRNALLAMRERPDVSAALAALPCPVQCIVGTEDTAVPADLSMRQLSLAKVTDAQVLAGVAHMGMYEATERVQAILADFWDFCARLAPVQ